MNIGISGYGRMGQAVEKQGIKKGHFMLQLQRMDLSAGSDLSSLDCIIDFSHFSRAPVVIENALRQGVNVVSGTTGFATEFWKWDDLAHKFDCAVCWASNFSLGMQITFAVNKYLAAIMKEFPEFSCRIHEVHHVHKIDQPSGTAISLAEQVVEAHHSYLGWRTDASQQDHVAITSERFGEVKGEHDVIYSGSMDRIMLRHEALSREGFASGAILTAEKLIGRTGFLPIEQLLGLTSYE